MTPQCRIRLHCQEEAGHCDADQRSDACLSKKVASHVQVDQIGDSSIIQCSNKCLRQHVGANQLRGGWSVGGGGYGVWGLQGKHGSIVQCSHNQQQLSYWVGGVRGWGCEGVRGGGEGQGVASHVQIDQIRYGSSAWCSHKSLQRNALTIRQVQRWGSEEAGSGLAFQPAWISHKVELRQAACRIEDLTCLSHFLAAEHALDQSCGQFVTMACSHLAESARCASTLRHGQNHQDMLCWKFKTCCDSSSPRGVAPMRQSSLEGSRRGGGGGGVCTTKQP